MQSDLEIEVEIPALGHGRLNMSDGPNLEIVDTQLFHFSSTTRNLSMCDRCNDFKQDRPLCSDGVKL